jgi:hypothetical protein
MARADRLQPLAACPDVASLSRALRELCAEFGKVMRIDVLTVTEAEKRKALCLLRLESALQEQRLIDSLGASRFGEDVLVVVELPQERSSPVV